jgi:hypothetical protein
MLPLSDGQPARRFPVVTVALIVANFAVWLFYERPGAPQTAALAADQAAGSGGWSWVLSDLKTLLETGRPLIT